MKIQDFEVSERRLRRFCRFLASNKAISFETLEHQLNQLQCKSSRGLVSPFGVAAVENLGLILLKTRLIPRGLREPGSTYLTENI